MDFFRCSLGIFRKKKERNILKNEYAIMYWHIQKQNSSNDMMCCVQALKGCLTKYLLSPEKEWQIKKLSKERNHKILETMEERNLENGIRSGRRERISGIGRHEAQQNSKSHSSLSTRMGSDLRSSNEAMVREILTYYEA